MQIDIVSLITIFILAVFVGNENDRQQDATTKKKSKHEK